MTEKLQIPQSHDIENAQTWLQFAFTKCTQLAVDIMFEKEKNLLGLTGTIDGILTNTILVIGDTSNTYSTEKKNHAVETFWVIYNFAHTFIPAILAAEAHANAARIDNYGF